MVLDKKIAIAKNALGIRDLNDWTQVRPEEITAVHDCGPQTRDHIRLYLAGHGLTLKDDQTPDFWQRNLGQVKIGAQLAESDACVTLPFTILVDKGEQVPWRFQGFIADAPHDDRPLLVPTELKHLGPSHGDYSIAGMEGQVHVERKGTQDAIGTFLAHGERRDNWLETLDFLAGIPTSAVVIESTLAQTMAAIQSRGARPRKTLQKTFHRQVLAWQQDFRVPFIFCDSRRFAEGTALAILRRHYKHATKAEKPTDREKQVNRLLDSI